MILMVICYNRNFSFKFIFTIDKCGVNMSKQDCMIGIKECGVYPICTSEHHSLINKMELDLQRRAKIREM